MAKEAVEQALADAAIPYEAVQQVRTSRSLVSSTARVRARARARERERERERETHTGSELHRRVWDTATETAPAVSALCMAWV